MPPKKPPYDWPATKAKRALAGVAADRLDRQEAGGTSHRILVRPGRPDVVFAYHDRVTLGPTAIGVAISARPIGEYHP